MKRCLVTGASGFVGRVLCEQLKKNGIIVRALLRHNDPGPWDEAVLSDLNAIEETSTELFSGVDTIFYLASIAHNKAPESSYDAINVQLCLRFAKAAIKHGIKRFIYVSSTKAMATAQEEVMDEKHSGAPADLYGISKRRAEEGLLALTGFEHLVIVRPCLIYGKRAQGNLLTMLSLIDRGFFPPLPETGARRSMVSVRDVASALIACAVSLSAHRKIYLVSDGTDYSVKEIENAMRHALHKKIPSWNIPTEFLKVAGYFGDAIQKVFGSFPVTSDAIYKLSGSARYSSEKIRQELNWSSTETFFQVLPEMVDDFVFRKRQK